MQFFVAKFNLEIKEMKKISVGLSLKLKKEKKKLFTNCEIWTPLICVS